MHRCHQLIVRRVQQEGDGHDEVRRKALWMVIIGVLFAVILFYIAARGLQYPQADALGYSIAGSACCVGLAYPLARRSLPVMLVGCVTVVLCVGAILVDVRSAAGRSAFRAWTCIVLVMDLCLALSVPTVYQKVILAITASWVVTFSVEGAYRLGLFDVHAFVGSGAHDMCDCAEPPCANGFFGAAMIIPTLTVLLGDYYATRDFAEGLRRQQSKVLASIEVAEQVATSLAGFDLSAAEEVLNNAGGRLPRRLGDGFRRLLANLASYRPYLPQTCFVNAGGADSEGSDGTQPTATLMTSSPRGGAEQRAPTSPGLASLGPEQGPFPRAATAELSADLASVTRRPSLGTTLGSFRRRLDAGSERRGSNQLGSFWRRPESSADRGCSDTASTASVVSHTFSDPGDLRSLRHVRALHAPQMRRLAVLTRNTTGFLAARAAPEAMGGWLAEQVELFAAAVQDQRGVTDHLSGDHLSASFGAVKVQGSCAVSAARAAAALTAHPAAGAVGLGALPHTAAVCCGRALCGDFGSSTCQRFMVIGPVSSFAVAAERAAAAWRVPALIDSATYEDAEQFWCCRLRQLVRFAKLSARAIGVWELMGERMGSGDDEWMYKLERATPNLWELYNRVLHTWCIGDTDRALGVAAEALDKLDAAGAADVVAGLRGLRELIREGAPAPVRDLSASAFAGEPAPVAPRCSNASVVQSFSRDGHPAA